MFYHWSGILYVSIIILQKYYCSLYYNEVAAGGFLFETDVQYILYYLYLYVHKLATKHTILAIFIACLVSKQSDICMCVMYVCPVTCY